MNLSVIVPTINSSHHIKENIIKLESIIKNLSFIKNYEIIIAAQTSTDNTFEIIKTLESPTIKPLFIQEKGKGIGISTGLRNAKFTWAMMVDDDLPYNIEKFLTDAQAYLRFQIIIASRYSKNYKIQFSKRTIFSWCYRMLTKTLFLLPFQDIQAGLKLIDRTIFNRTIIYPKEHGYIWDTELLYLAKNKVFIQELYAELIENKPNQLRISKDIPKMVWQILKLRWRTLWNL